MVRAHEGVLSTSHWWQMKPTGGQIRRRQRYRGRFQLAVVMVEVLEARGTEEERSTVGGAKDPQYHNQSWPRELATQEMAGDDG